MAHPFLHFATITRHRHLVMKHCRKAGIFWQGLRHDLSKYSPTEFWAGARYYQGNRSPNESERETIGYSLAWMHHKGRNRHHFEYWVDIDPATKQYRPVPMPPRYVAEMFCDRVAASKIYRKKEYRDGDAYAYYLRGRAKTLMHPDTARMLEKWLRELSENGEKAAFSMVRADLKEAKKQEKEKKKKH